MTLYQFKCLDINDQFSEVWDNGTFLLSRKEKCTQYLLYQMNDFYVEICYDNEGNELEGLKSFKTTDLLNPYLEQINITDIFF